MIKKVISILVILVFLFIQTLPAIAANISELKEQKQEVEDQKDKVTSKKNDVLDEISELNAQIKKYENDISELNNKIDKLEDSIVENEEKIKELEEETAEREELLINRLVAMYEMGRTSYLDVLLKSEDMTSFISNYYRIEELADADQGIIDSVIEKQEETEQTKQKLEKEQKEVTESKKEVENKNQSLQTAKATKQSKVNSLSSKEKELQSKIDDFEAAIKKAEKEIQQAANEAASNGGEYIGSFEGTLSWPLSSSTPYYNYISSYFGPRPSPTAGASSNHGAVDIPVSYAPIYAPAAGRVIIAWSLSGYGNYVMIDHGNGYYTGFGHLSSFNVSAGQTVSRGQQIAVSGNTGISTGPHLHYEVYIGGTTNSYRVDPLQHTTHPELYSL